MFDTFFLFKLYNKGVSFYFHACYYPHEEFKLYPFYKYFLAFY